MRDRDVVRCLRALDLALADVAPSPRLGARISARMRAEAGARRWPPGGDVAWLVPLGFATAAAAVALIVGGARPGSVDHRAADTGDPMEIRRDKPSPDAGPDIDAPRRAAPRIHAPGLVHPSSREDAPPPPPSARPPVPDDPRAPGPRGAVVEDPLAPAPTAKPPRGAPSSAPMSPSGGSSIAPSRNPARLGPFGVLHGLSPASRPRAGESVIVEVDPVIPAFHASSADPDPSCEAPEVLKLEATISCKEQGMVPSTFVYLDPCGDGRYRGVEPKCVPSPEGSEGSCVGGAVGDGVACVDDAVLEKEAQALCAAEGLPLSGFYPDDAGCAGSARIAKYLCCGPQVPSPGGGSCFTMDLGDGGTCQTLTSIAGEAHALCEQKGGEIADLSIVKGCEGGGALVVSFTCCPGDEPGK